MVCEMLPKPRGRSRGRSRAHLAAVPPGEQDQHGAGGDGRPQAPLVLAERLLAVAQQLPGNVLRGVVPGLGTEHKHLVFHLCLTGQQLLKKVLPFSPQVQLSEGILLQTVLGNTSNILCPALYLCVLPPQHSNTRDRELPPKFPSSPKKPGSTAQAEASTSPLHCGGFSCGGCLPAKQ